MKAQEAFTDSRLSNEIAARRWDSPTRPNPCCSANSDLLLVHGRWIFSAGEDFLSDSVVGACSGIRRLLPPSPRLQWCTHISRLTVSYVLHLTDGLKRERAAGPPDYWLAELQGLKQSALRQEFHLWPADAQVQLQVFNFSLVQIWDGQHWFHYIFSNPGRTSLSLFYRHCLRTIAEWNKKFLFLC